MTNYNAVKFAENDNVATAIKNLIAGTTVFDGIVCVSDIREGHKISLCDIKCGDDIIKYGICIARATEDIPVGSHVHIHNACSLVDKRSSGFTGDEAAPQDMSYELPEDYFK